MKRIASRPSKTCNILLGAASVLHISTGVAVIVFQIMLIHAGSPYHDISGGLWSGPVFFIQGILGLVSLCDTLMCSIVSFLIISVGSSLLTVAVAAIAAIDLGSIYKCPEDDHYLTFSPPYCTSYAASRILLASWGLVITASIQLVASAFSVYCCMRFIYKSETDSYSSRASTPYLYGEIPAQERRGSLPDLPEKMQSTVQKSSYSLSSTLPVRTKSVDRFTESTEFFVDQTVQLSTHSVNAITDRMRTRYTPVPHSHSKYSVNEPSRPTRGRSCTLPINDLQANDLPGYMKHTAV